MIIAYTKFLVLENCFMNRKLIKTLYIFFSAEIILKKQEKTGKLTL